MAAADVKVYDEIQNLFWKFIFPVVLTIILLNILSGQLRTLYLRVFAYFMNKISIRMNKKFGWRKEKLFSELHKMPKESNRAQYVLEIGAGSGANFQYLPDETNLICVDPNPHFESYLTEKREKHSNIRFKEFVVATAEDMSLVPNNCIDAVISTLVLCTVEDVEMSLSEIKRVLRPGGKFFYLEHVAADTNTWTWKLQRFINPLHKRVADNCQVIRRTWLDIENAGFSKVEHERFWTKLTFNLLASYPPIRPMLIGMATK